MLRSFSLAFVLSVCAVAPAAASCEDEVVNDPETIACYIHGPEEPLPHELFLPPTLYERYAHLAEQHRLHGTASYYAQKFDGRKTASGEIFRQKRPSAAHRTLPLGCTVEVRSLATGRKLRLRVNDRGPYKGGFILDLSKSAARYLGVDRALDRRVEIRVLALPGDEPPPEFPNYSQQQLASAE